MATTNKKEEEEVTIGLALSGGILVAAAGGSACMRGFQQQTIVDADGTERPAMEAFDYVSGLSGGCVPTMLYTYAQNVTTNELLDADFRINDPSEITPEALGRHTGKSLFENSVKTLSFRFIPVLIYRLLICNLHRFWTVGFYRAILSSYGIQRKKRISSDENKKQEDGFLGPRKGIKATPLINFIAMGKAEDGARDSIDDYYKVVHKLKQEYGNTFVPPEKLLEVINSIKDPDLFIPYIFSPNDVRNAMPAKGSEYTNEMNMNVVPIRKWGGRDNICSIEFFMAVATNFLGMGGISEKESVMSSISSELAARRRVKLGDGGVREKMLFVDGGYADGLGVPALVQRKVRRIVASIWPHSLARHYHHHYDAAKGKDINEWLKHAKSLAFGDIASYFGYFSTDMACFFDNRIFEDGPARLEQLRNDVDALYEAGKPIVVTMKDLTTVHNPFWGVEGGNKVDLTIIYWTLPKDFADKVPLESVPPPKDPASGKPMPKCDAATGLFTNKEFEDFPNFNGLTNTGGNILWKYIRFASLSRRQANMMAYLGSWVINEAWEGLSVDGRQIFGGFKDILQKKSEV